MADLIVLIIRHAEKPNESWPGPGLTAEGSADQKSLVIRGWQRAGSWSALFGAALGGAEFPRPALIYAANPNGTSGDKASQRPLETITPLATRLKLNPVVTYSLGQESELVSEISGLSGTVLVCWEHKAIVAALIPALVGDASLQGVPRKWDGTRFDVVLRFERGASGAPWSFQQLFPRLLSGDVDTPMT